MNLELREIDGSNVEVYSIRTNVLAGNLLLDSDGIWYFRYSDCQCVWSSEVLLELANIVQSKNNQ